MLISVVLYVVINYSGFGEECKVYSIIKARACLAWLGTAAKLVFLAKSRQKSSTTGVGVKSNLAWPVQGVQ